MQVDEKGKAAGDPVVVLLADGDIHQSLLGVEVADLGLLALEGEVFEDQGNDLSWLQEEGVVLAYQVISFGFRVVAVYE